MFEVYFWGSNTSPQGAWKPGDIVYFCQTHDCSVFCLRNYLTIAMVILIIHSSKQTHTHTHTRSFKPLVTQKRAFKLVCLCKRLPSPTRILLKQKAGFPDYFVRFVGEVVWLPYRVSQRWYSQWRIVTGSSHFGFCWISVFGYQVWMEWWSFTNLSFQEMLDHFGKSLES